MLQRHSFIPVFSCLIGGLALWSSQVQSPNTSASTSFNLDPETQKSQTLNRRDLIETLDRVVAYQHYYRSVYGRYTKFINRTGFNLPSNLADHFEVRIVEATADRLLVNAFSEVSGKTFDLVSIDQDYKLHANFELPEPRPEYLKDQAIKHLRLVKDLPAGQDKVEDTVFKGFFKYTVQTNSKNEKVGLAIGLQSPVKGTRVELSEATDLMDNPESLVFSDLMKDPSDTYIPAQTGQFMEDAGNQLEGETFLAQKIFRGEMGRYAKSWSELSRIAHFRFERKDQFTGELGVPLSNLENPISSNLLRKIQNRKSEMNRKVSSDTLRKRLEIEPIRSDN